MDKNVVTPLVSVIMPIYNCSKYIKLAVDSILNQSYQNFELIIIDDCSQDSTLEVVKSYRDNRIVLIEKPLNTGYTDSINHGIKIAKGVYLARMDGDDISHRCRLEIQVNFMEMNPQLVCCGTRYRIIGSNFTSNPEISHTDIVLEMVDSCPMAHPSVIMRKNTLLENNLMYDVTFEPAEDYKMWSELIYLGLFANINQVLLDYRVYPEQTSSLRQSEQQSKSRLIRKLYLKRMNLSENQIDIFLADKISNFQELMAYTQAEKCLNNSVKLYFNSVLNKKKLKNRLKRKIEKNLISDSYNPIKAFRLTAIIATKGIWIDSLLYVKFICKCFLFYKPRKAK